MRILLFFLLISSSIFAHKPKSTPDYSVSYAKDSVSKTKGARLKFVCKFDSEYEPHRKLRYGIDGSDEIADLNDQNVYEFVSSPGAHVFQFFYDLNYQEIITDSIEVETGKITIILLHFKNQYEPRPVKKPVIYLYPESDTGISVQLKTKGDLTFSYPDYSKGWKGTAHPDGSIDINGTHYPYLFWESEQHFNTFDTKIGGFMLNKAQIVESLKKNLSELDFNDKEKTDFITFWGPQLQQYKQVLIQFIINDACDEFATLEIDPKPKHLNRVYMVWSPVNVEKPQILKPQVLKKLNRDGFDVLEWGGIEIKKVSDL